MGFAVIGMSLITALFAQLMMAPAQWLPRPISIHAFMHSLTGSKLAAYTKPVKCKVVSTHVILAGFVQNKHCIFSFFGGSCLTCGRGAVSWGGGGCEAILDRSGVSNSRLSKYLATTGRALCYCTLAVISARSSTTSHTSVGTSNLRGNFVCLHRLISCGIMHALVCLEQFICSGS